MHKKAFVLMFVAVMFCGMLFSGCATAQAPTLPNIDLDGSSLTGTVESVNGQTCQLRITVEDSHYDENDIVYVTYSSISSGKSVSVGDEVRFSYNYSMDVSEYNGEPHVTVNEISVK